jgi:hypothetical protein
MHIRFRLSGGKMTECPMCISEQGNPRDPNFKPVNIFSPAGMKKHSLPCPKHGDARICSPNNQDAIDMFVLMAKHKNFIFYEHEQGGKRFFKRNLDLSLCLKMCREYGVDPIPTLKKLDILLEEVS